MYPAGRTILHLLILEINRFLPAGPMSIRRSVFSDNFFLFLYNLIPTIKTFFCQNHYTQKCTEKKQENTFFILAPDSPMDI